MPVLLVFILAALIVPPAASPVRYVTLTADVTSAMPGQTFTYTITLYDESGAPADATLILLPDEDMTLVGTPITPDAPCDLTPYIRCVVFPAAGAPAVITMTMRLNPDQSAWHRCTDARIRSRAIGLWGNPVAPDAADTAISFVVLQNTPACLTRIYLPLAART